MKFLSLAAVLLAGSTALAQPAKVEDLPASVLPTNVEDPAALARLRRNSGITLQWIGWERRGRLAVSERNGRVHLSGSQAGNGGRLTIDGDVSGIGATSFTFRGRIVIADTPDPGRNCVRDGIYQFRVTGGRRYWRLQEMEVCDGLTDYVDIYF
ncbi:MAG TPA: hypothetical protein VEW04_09155 [Allosphingosinicella sp.]|nr:hypothetical protein [Allosphingosinicella sp.]